MDDRAGLIKNHRTHQDDKHCRDCKGERWDAEHRGPNSREKGHENTSEQHAAKEAEILLRFKRISGESEKD